MGHARQLCHEVWWCESGRLSWLLATYVSDEEHMPHSELGPETVHGMDSVLCSSQDPPPAARNGVAGSPDSESENGSVSSLFFPGHEALALHVTSQILTNESRQANTLAPKSLWLVLFAFLEVFGTKCKTVFDS